MPFLVVVLLRYEFTFELPNEEIFFVGKLVIFITYDEENVEELVILDTENGNSWGIYYEDIPQYCVTTFENSEPNYYIKM